MNAPLNAPLLQTKDLQLAFGAVVVADHIDFTLHLFKKGRSKTIYLDFG